MTLTEIKEIFYEKDSNLYWKISKQKVKKDSLAGSIDSGYWKVKLKGKNYKVHRLLYQIYNNLEEIPEGLVIDHSDRDTNNNSKENLRLCTRSENCCNTNINKNNKLGIKNICIFNSKWKSYYNVSIRKNKNSIIKLFPYTSEGLKLAITWRDQMLQELHGEFSSKG